MKTRKVIRLIDVDTRQIIWFLPRFVNSFPISGSNLHETVLSLIQRQQFGYSWDICDKVNDEHSADSGTFGPDHTREY